MAMESISARVMFPVNRTVSFRCLFSRSKRFEHPEKLLLLQGAGCLSEVGNVNVLFFNNLYIENYVSIFVQYDLLKKYPHLLLTLQCINQCI